jgi:hypothetical protein
VHGDHCDDHGPVSVKQNEKARSAKSK